MTTRFLTQRWTSTPVAQRVLLVAVILFGSLGVLHAVTFLTDISGPTATTHQWAAALGLAVAVNSFSWLLAWRDGTFKKLSRVLLAVALLLFTFFALYVGLQAVRAGSLGVGLLDV